jgi:hypothetical protein
MSATSLIRSLLWLFSISLTLFVAAMSVSPAAAATNVTRWLTLLGLTSASGWFTLHAKHRVHLSADAVTRTMNTSKCVGACAHPMTSSSPSIDVPDVILMALGALLLAVVLIWLIPRRRVSLLDA